MGRIGRRYPRAFPSAQVPIKEQRVLFLTRAAAVRHRLLKGRSFLLAFVVFLVGASLVLTLH
jgi:hypothetical protein